MITVDDRLRDAATEVRNLAERAPLPRLGTIRVQPLRRQAPRWVAAGVAAGLVMIALAGAAWIIQGSAPEVAEEPVLTSFVAPEVTPSTATPTTIPVDPVTLPYNELLDSSAAALYTSMALASDGSPVVVSLVSDANVVGSYEQATISVIRLVACLDPNCVESPVIVDLGEFEGWTNGPVRLALDPLDRPVVLYPGEESPQMAFCDDSVCSSFETRPVDEAAIWGFGVFGDWAFAPGGNPVYPASPPDGLDGLDLVACLDRFCDEKSRTKIDTVFVGSLNPPRVAADGSLLLVYATEEPTGAQKVAWCADVTCSEGPVVTTIDQGIGVGAGYPLEGSAGIEIWYTSTEEASRGPRVVVTDAKATCLNVACTEFKLTYLGPQGFWDGNSTSVQAEILSSDGSRLELRRDFDGGGSPLVLARHSGGVGGTWAYTTLTTAECAFGFHEGYCEESYRAQLAIGNDGLPVVVYGDDAGLHLIRCPDLACTPPKGE